MLTKKFSPALFILIFTLLLNGSLSARAQTLNTAQQEQRPAHPQEITISIDLPVYFKASNTNDWDRFGTSVALSGSTLVVGAPGESSSATDVDGNQGDNSKASAGAAYVFVYDGADWIQQAYLKASNTDTYDFFGESVAISGDTIVIGARNECSSAAGGPDDNSASHAGAAYVFTRSGSTWTPQAMLKASNAESNDEFGISVAISGDRIVVGAYAEDSNGSGGQSNNSAADSGAAYVFERSDSSWSQVAYLKASNTEAGDLFGYSVAIDTDMALVGAPWEGSDANGLDGDQNNNSAWFAGAAYAFYRSSGTWSQVRYIKASNSDADDQFGRSVAMSDLGAVVGAPNEDSSTRVVNGDQADNSSESAGAAYVFEHIGSVFTPQVAYLKATNAEVNDRFGWSVALTEWEEVLVGARLEGSSATGVNGPQNDNSASGAGAAYFFFHVPGVGMKQHYYLKASNTNAGDYFGSSVAATTDFIVVGALYEDSSATGLYGDQDDNAAINAGAAYIPGGLWHYNYLPLLLGASAVP
jgi:drug/metabolite transporter superfamily protein YnfA